MEALGITLAILAILVGGVWLTFSIAHDTGWAQRIIRQGDAQAQAWGERGYKVNISGFYAWLARSRLRAAATGILSIAFGVWFIVLTR